MVLVKGSVSKFNFAKTVAAMRACCNQADDAIIVILPRSEMVFLGDTRSDHALELAADFVAQHERRLPAILPYYLVSCSEEVATSLSAKRPSEAVDFITRLMAQY